MMQQAGECIESKTGTQRGLPIDGEDVEADWCKWMEVAYGRREYGAAGNRLGMQEANDLDEVGWY